MTIKAVLFDKDGTLFDFNATFAPAVKLLLLHLADDDAVLTETLANAVGFDMDTLAFSTDSVLIAGSLEDITAVLMPLTDTTGATDHKAFNKKVDNLFVEYSKACLAPFDTLHPTLDALDAVGVPMGIATNDSENAAYAHLNETGITERFVYIAGYDSGHGAKPGPGMVLAFAEHLGLPPETVMMVGDSTHDCQAGQAAGACTVAVTTGLAKAEDLAPHADHVLSNIGEIPDLIKRLNGGTS